jgi:hypothetical protein
MKPHMPKDLKLIVKSKELILWEKVITNCKATIENCENEIAINKELLAIAESKCTSLS